MPVRFVGLNSRFNALARAAGYEAFDMRVEDYAPRAGRTTFYVSPANSLCFMDGGIDRALSRAVFPGIEAKVKAAVRWLDRRSLLGRAYLPVGSALIVEPDASPRPRPRMGPARWRWRPRCFSHKTCRRRRTRSTARWP